MSCQIYPSVLLWKLKISLVLTLIFDEFEKYGRDDFLSEDDEDEYEEEDEEDGALRRPKKKSTKKSIYEVSVCGTDIACIAEYGKSNIDAVQ